MDHMTNIRMPTWMAEQLKRWVYATWMGEPQKCPLKAPDVLHLYECVDKSLKGE